MALQRLPRLPVLLHQCLPSRRLRVTVDSLLISQLLQSSVLDRQAYSHLSLWVRLLHQCRLKPSSRLNKSPPQPCLHPLGRLARLRLLNIQPSPVDFRSHPRHRSFRSSRHLPCPQLSRHLKYLQAPDGIAPTQRRLLRPLQLLAGTLPRRRRVHRHQRLHLDTPLLRQHSRKPSHLSAMRQHRSRRSRRPSAARLLLSHSPQEQAVL